MCNKIMYCKQNTAPQMYSAKLSKLIKILKRLAI